MNNLMSATAVASMLICLAPGCVNFSKNYDTNHIEARFVVTTDESGQSHLRGELRVNEIQRLELSAGDTLVAEVEGRRIPIPMVESGQYEASLGVLAEGVEVRIELRRRTRESAFGTMVKIPAAFELGPVEYEDVLSGPTVSLRSVVFTWDPPLFGLMRVEADAECIRSLPHPILDSGRYSMPFAVGAENDAEEPPEPCEGTMTFSRSEPGEVSDAFDLSSRIHAEQVRQVSFSLMP